MCLFSSRMPHVPIDRFIYTIKHRTPSVFAFINSSAAWLTRLRHAHRREKVRSRSDITGTIRGQVARVRCLEVDDAEILFGFLHKIPEERFRFFKPHDFSREGVLRVLHSRNLLCSGVFIDHKIVAYALIKLFPTRSAYLGLIASADFSGFGLGKYIWRYLIWQSAIMKIRPCATIHVENLASLGSLRSVRPGIVSYQLPGNYLRIDIPVVLSDLHRPELEL